MCVLQKKGFFPFVLVLHLILWHVLYSVVSCPINVTHSFFATIRLLSILHSRGSAVYMCMLICFDFLGVRSKTLIQLSSAQLSSAQRAQQSPQASQNPPATTNFSRPRQISFINFCIRKDYIFSLPLPLTVSSQQQLQVHCGYLCVIGSLSCTASLTGMPRKKYSCVCDNEMLRLVSTLCHGVIVRPDITVSSQTLLDRLKKAKISYQKL